MSFSYTLSNDTFDIYASGGNQNITGATNTKNVFFIGTGDDTIHGGNQGDQIHLGIDNNLVFAGNGDNEIWTGGGQDVIYGGTGNDWIHVETGGQAIMFGHTGENFFDFSQDNPTGFSAAFTGRSQTIADFNMDDHGTYDTIVANQSVFNRGVHVIDANGVTNINQAAQLALASDAGHNYGAVYVANHATGDAFLLMDSGGDHSFATGVTMAGAANHVTDAQAAHSMILPS